MVPSYLLRVALILTLTTTTIQAQTTDRYAVLQNNYQIINPAANNHNHQSVRWGRSFTTLSLRHKSQPNRNSGIGTSQNIRVEQAGSGRRVNLSGSFFREHLNVQQTLQLSGNAAYQIDLDRRGSSPARAKILSLGIGAAYNNYSADLQQLSSPTPDYRILPVASARFYTLSAGAFLLLNKRRSPGFYAGLSLHQQVGFPEAPISRQVFALAGMTFTTTNRLFLFEPNVQAQYANYDGFLFTNPNQEPLTITAGTRIWYDNATRFGGFVGANLNTSDRASFELGLSISGGRAIRAKRVPPMARQKRRNAGRIATRVSYNMEFDLQESSGTAHSIMAIFPFLTRKRRKQ